MIIKKLRAVLFKQVRNNKNLTCHNERSRAAI
jgi:hypothetical protein